MGSGRRGFRRLDVLKRDDDAVWKAAFAGFRLNATCHGCASAPPNTATYRRHLSPLHVTTAHQRCLSPLRITAANQRRTSPLSQHRVKLDYPIRRKRERHPAVAGMTRHQQTIAVRKTLGRHRGVFRRYILPASRQRMRLLDRHGRPCVRQLLNQFRHALRAQRHRFAIDRHLDHVLLRPRNQKLERFFGEGLFCQCRFRSRWRSRRSRRS